MIMCDAPLHPAADHAAPRALCCVVARPSEEPLILARRRLWFALMIALGGVIVPAMARSNPRLEVRGSSHFDVQAKPSRGEVVVFGALLDDAGHALGSTPITVKLSS